MARHFLREHDISHWDPMSEDYYDLDFNNYAHGPGSRLDRNLLPCQPRINRVNTEYKLYIRNIQPDMTENGIRNIFLNYGNPLNVYRYPTDVNLNPTWGLVSYAFYREAELAIRKLNDAPPFYLKVQFARSAADKERIRKQQENEELLSRALEVEPYPVNPGRLPFAPFSKGIGRGRGIPMQQHMGIGRYHSRYETAGFSNDDAFADRDMDYFSHHVPGAYDETNRMIMEQKTNRTFRSITGTRLVSMGRGYFPASESPPLQSKCDIQIKRYGKDEKHILARSVERMYDLWHEFGKRESKSGKLGNCSYCHKIASKQCQQCLAWYCTTDCQRNDWPRHRTDCIPKLSASGSKFPVSPLNHAPPHVHGAKQRHEPGSEMGDVHQTGGQNINGASEHGDSFINSNVNKEEESKIPFMENYCKQNYSDGPNRSTDCGKNTHDHRNAHFPDIRKDRYRSKNSSSEGHTRATEAKRSSANERLSVAREKESGRNALVASRSTISHQIEQQSAAVSSCVHGGQVKPLAENAPNVPVFGKDMHSDKGDAIKVVTPGATVVSPVNKMGTPDVTSSSCVGRSMTEELPKNRFTKVKISAVAGPMDYWVRLVDSEPKLFQVMKVLYELPELLPCKLEVGAMCAAFYENLWYRGKVTSVEPELKVLYIDYGNEEVCTPTQVQGLPSSVMDIPPLGLRINLAEGTSEKYSRMEADEMLSVKPVGETSNGTVVVHVEGEVYSPAVVTEDMKLLHAKSVPQNSSVTEETAHRTHVSNTPDKCPLPRPKKKLQSVKDCARRSALDGLKVGMQGAGEFRQQLIGGDCSLTIVYPELTESVKLLSDLTRACKSVPVDEKYTPSIGDMVGAENGDTWNRGHILSIRDSGSYHVSFCDIGCTGIVRVVKKLPQNLALVPEIATRCSIISSTKAMENIWSGEDRRFLFMVTSVDEIQKAVTCVLYSPANEEICRAVLKQWVPSVEDEGLKIVEVKNNDAVILQVFFDQKSLYIRPASSSAKDMFCQLNQDVGAHCIKASELEYMPSKNEMVACKFVSDGNYYRAKVLDVSEGTVKIVYVDFGNLDSATKDRLKPLPNSLKKIPCMAVKVGLKDALDKPLTVDASDFLSDFVRRETEMKLILAGSHKDKVQLMLPDGSSLNDRLNTLLEPEWKRTMAAGKDPRECENFMGDDIKYLELPVGQSIDFFVLHIVDSVTVMGCETNGKTMMYVHTTMNIEMNSYCNSTPEKSYIPRYSELCFAKFDDNVWYRAIYLGNETSREKNVIFLDFGNMATVEKENIRKMIKDYVETPAVAVTCSLQGLENADEKLKKRVSELVQVNKNYKARVVSCSDPGSYVIELPHVTEALAKENLLPSEK